MEKVLTSRIAAAYFGCEVIVKGWDRDEADSPPIKMTALSEESICLGKNKNGIDMWVKTSACKLILKPEDDISEEDTLHIATITDKPDFRIHEIVDYVRSRGYDVGHVDIPSLLDCGIAININSNKE